MTRAPSAAMRRLAVAALVCGLALLAALAPSQARADEPARTELGTASLVVPDGWSWQPLHAMSIAGMQAHIGAALAPDERVRVFVLVIDPFGLDLPSWTQDDLLGAVVLELMASSGYFSRNMIVRRTNCVIADQEREGRLVIFPREGDKKRLISGLACGLAQATRWAMTLVLVDSWYDRPLLLEQEIDDAAALMGSLRFD